MKPNATALLLGLGLAAVASAFGLVELRTEAAVLRGEIKGLAATRMKLGGDLENSRRLFHEREEAETQRAFAAASGQTSLSPGQLRMLKIEQAERRFAARLDTLIPGTAAEGDGFLVQGKVGKLYFAELLGDPGYDAAAVTLEREQVAIAYGRFFAGLHLDPATQAKLEDLLVQQEMTRQDIVGLARDSDPSSKEVRTVETREWKSTIHETFGVDVARQLSLYKGSIHLREAVDNLEMRLSYTEAPLRSTQSEQLFQALTGALGSRVKTRYWAIPDEVIGQTKTFLSPPQQVALKQIREEQLDLIDTRTSK